MKTYETSAIIDAAGQLCVSGVPFAPGTQVEVRIQPAPDSASEAGGDPATRLLVALDQGRNTEAVGPLRREQLYDRDVPR